MIKTLQYLKGKTKALSFDRVNLLRGLTWIDAYDLNLKDLHSVSDKLKFPLRHLKYALDTHEVARVEKYKNYILIIFKVLHENKTKTLGVMFNRKVLLTVHPNNLKLVLEPDDFKNGLSHCVYKILSLVIKEFSLELEKNEDYLDSLEKSIFRKANERNVERIFELKKSLLYLRKALSANIEVVSRISDEEHFKELQTEIRQLIDIENTQASRLTSILDMYMSSVSNNLNTIMKSFTVIASILLLPMLIAGIYGMNLVLPLANNQNGFWILLLIMLFCVVLMLFYFKRRSWI